MKKMRFIVFDDIVGRPLMEDEAHAWLQWVEPDDGLVVEVQQSNDGTAWRERCEARKEICSRLIGDLQAKIQS